MRNWASTLGVVGGVASAAFWTYVPMTATHESYFNAGLEPLYVSFVVLSLAGLLGGLMAGRSTRVAPLLMALAVIPGVGALFLPGLVLTVGALLAITPITDERRLIR